MLIYEITLFYFHVQRFGSFEICKDTDPMTGRRGPSVGKYDIIQKLLNYVIKTFYPEVCCEFNVLIFN